MEILSGRSRITDLHIVFRTQLQIAFETSRRMFRALALVAMREKEHESAAFLPLVLGRCNVLIDDDLCTVREISELRFPCNKLIAFVADGIPVFEPEHSGFRKAAVENIEPSVTIAFAFQFAERC